MAIDYLFVSQVFTFVLSIFLMFMAFTTESIYKIVLHFLSGIGFFFLAQLMLMAYTSSAAMIPMHYYFYLFSVVNIFLSMMYGLMGLTAFRRNKRRSKEPDMI